MTKLNVSTSYYNYNIYLGNKLELKEFFIPYKNQTLFIITDSNLDVLYKDYLQEQFNDFNYQIIVVEAGEKSKSFQVYQEVIINLLKNEMTKKDLIIAFGGGVIGDLAGFIAGTIFRGVKFINVPTTLLAMSDSSIGGKTGIDTEYGKNLVGVFKQPEFVIIDTFYLKTLNNDEYSNGMAEIIKAGLIADKELIDYLLTDTVIDTEVIFKALQVKKKIVEKDPYEENIRMLLNFGHTFGHAIEQYHDYKLRHGYCVALGMDLAIRFGIKINRTNKKIPSVLKALYKKYNLVEFKGDSNVYLKNIKYDKKNYNEHLNFVILKEIGQAEIIKIKEENLNDL